MQAERCWCHHRPATERSTAWIIGCSSSQVPTFTLLPPSLAPFKQDPKVVISVLMKLAGGSPSFAGELNIDAFLEQVGGMSACLPLNSGSAGWAQGCVARWELSSSVVACMGR